MPKIASLLCNLCAKSSCRDVIHPCSLSRLHGVSACLSPCTNIGMQLSCTTKILEVRRKHVCGLCCKYLNRFNWMIVLSIESIRIVTKVRGRSTFSSFLNVSNPKQQEPCGWVRTSPVGCKFLLTAMFCFAIQLASQCLETPEPKGTL